MASNYTYNQSNFGFGEISPIVQGLPTTSAYAQGLSYAQNVFFTQTGAILKRNGTKIGNTVLPQGNNCVIKACNIYSMSISVILTEYKCHIVYNTNGNILAVLNTPYADNHINSISICVVENSIYFVSRYYHPKVVTIPNFYHSFTELTLINKGQKTISAENLINNNPTDVESMFFSFTDEQVSIADVVFKGNVDFSTAKNFPSVAVFKGGRLFLACTINNPSGLWVSRSRDDDGNLRVTDFTLTDKYTSVTTYSNVTQVANETETQSAYTISNTDSQVTLDNPYVDGDVEYSKVQIAKDVISGTDTNGRATTITTTQWRSCSFTYITLASHAIEHIEADMRGSKINWIEYLNRVLIGYGSSLWMDDGNVTSPLTFDLNRTSAIGNTNVKPATYNNYLFFVGMDCRSVYMSMFSTESGGFVSNCISNLSSNLFTANIKEICIIDSVIPMLFVLQENGALCCCSINISTGQFGWSRISVEGSSIISSISATRTDFSDSLVLIVKDGGENKLEYLDINNEFSEDIPHLDGLYKLKSTANPKEFYCDYYAYEDKNVSVSADGEYIGEYKLVGSLLKLNKNYTTVYIGRKFTTLIGTINPQLPANGDSMCKNRQISKQFIYTYNTRQFDIMRPKNKNIYHKTFNVYGKSEYGTLYDANSGWCEVPVITGATTDARFYIQDDSSYPLCIASTSTKYIVQEV